MGDPKWTGEQLDAITEKNCNLLVAAAAGAGKTAVLVERIIRKITDEKDPVDIDQLLVVTFTNAAATEMRERIGAAIAKALDQDPDSRILQRQMALLHKASITTIHSFCLEVIRNHFHCIDLDPSFRIIDDTEATLMKLEALEEIFEDSYESDVLDSAFLDLVECYGGSKDDRDLQNMVLTLYEFVQSHPWPDKWLKEKTDAFNLTDDTDFGSTAWGSVLKKSIRIDLWGLYNRMKKAVELIRVSPGLEPYLPNFEEETEGIRKLIESCDSVWDELYKTISRLGFKTLKRCGKDADKNIQDQVKNIRDSVKGAVKDMKDMIFAFDSESIIKDLRFQYPLIQALSRLVMNFQSKYSQKKRQRLLLDFNDLEHFCLQILTQRDPEGRIIPSAPALEYRERFREILVDEYQDSNLVQEVILSVISRKDTENPNVFMVGDVKQSIYRFRQARPELFMEKYHTYSQRKGSKNRKIKLFKNFRSRGEVINAVNFLFKQMMCENVGELEYDDEEALNLGASFEPLHGDEAEAGGPVELHIIDMDGDDLGYDGQNHEPADDEETEGENSEGYDQPEELLDDIQAEARLVAKRIQELISPGPSGKPFMIYDKRQGGYRSLEYRDIVVLLRTTRGWANVFMEEMASQGIPAYADTGTGYFQTVEVQTMMSLLQIIDNPMQDIPMLSVLRSPIASFTPEELIDIRLADRECSFYEAMKKAALGSDETARKTADFLSRLQSWRDKALYTPTDELIWYLYNDTGYYSYTGAMPGGIQRQANLRMLFERARQYEETSYKGLFNFIYFISKLKSSSGDMGSAKILGENENVVRIMSIHKSKGLEFPVVFVSGCGKGFNFQDLNRSILVHQDLGFGPNFVDHQRRIYYPTLAKQAIKYKIRMETLSEEMRILYVAFTRAREKLIITGKVKDAAKTFSKWCECIEHPEIKLPEYNLLKGKCYLDWIGLAVARHKDCCLLRQMGGFADNPGESFLEDQSLWLVKLWSKKDVLRQSEPEALQEDSQSLLWLSEDDGDQLDYQEGPYMEEIKRRLGWVYPYSMAGRLPTKISVTELKRHFDSEIQEEYTPAALAYVPLVKKPLFLEETKGFSAAERGSIMHFSMQHLNLSKVSSLQEIKLQINGMVENELLTRQQSQAVDIDKIFKFFSSPIGRRMVNAHRVYREMPFNIELKSTEIHKDLPKELYENETMLLQGVIDCFFEEDRELVLLDYKTDYVSPDGMEAIRKGYETQILYYTRALEKITGKRVKEKYIYLFWNGNIIEYK